MGLFSKKPSTKSAGQDISSKHKKSYSLQSKEDGQTERKVMENAERELYQYDQPKQELGMSDLIKNHETGTRFMYAAISGRESEDMESRLRRLINYKPKLNRKFIPIDDLPTIRLYKETEVFPLNQIVLSARKRNPGTKSDYVRVSDAIVMYGAVVSPDCHFTHVNVGITDDRLLNERTVKSFRATSNQANKGNLSLPYCVPVDECECLKLTVSRERAFLESDKQWGAIQIQVMLEFTSFPMQYSNIPVAALNMITDSTLENPINNPNNIDISILNQDRLKLANLYLDGEIADEDTPIKNKTEAVKYAKSSIAGVQKGKQIENKSGGWEFMNGTRYEIEADQNSFDPIEEGSLNHEISEKGSLSGVEHFLEPQLNKSIKSAMKKSVQIRDPTPPSSNHGKFKRNNIDRLTPF